MRIEIVGVVSDGMRGAIAFDADTWEMDAAWSIGGFGVGYELDPEGLRTTSSGGMFVNGLSYGTCQFCLDGFRVRSAHFIEKNNEIVCSWIETGGAPR